MRFTEIKAKGLAKCLAAPGLTSDKLDIHITEVEPGNRSHAEHAHTGVEVFYMLEGQATVEVEDELYPLRPNEALSLIHISEPTRPY